MKDKSGKRRVRPGELLIISAVFGLFTLGITFMGSRQLVLSLIFGGLAFILCVVVFSILSLAASPVDDKRDMSEPVLGRPFPLSHSQPQETVEKPSSAGDNAGVAVTPNAANPGESEDNSTNK